MDKNGFVEDEYELMRILPDIIEYESRLKKYSWNPGIGNAKFFKGYKYWNCRGKEFGTDFPTIYWSIELEKEVRRLVAIYGRDKAMEITRNKHEGIKKT